MKGAGFTVSTLVSTVYSSSLRSLLIAMGSNDDILFLDRTLDSITVLVGVCVGCEAGAGIWMFMNVGIGGNTSLVGGCVGCEKTGRSEIIESLNQTMHHHHQWRNGGIDIRLVDQKTWKRGKYRNNGKNILQVVY